MGLGTDKSACEPASYTLMPDRTQHTESSPNGRDHTGKAGLR